jgi:cytoskeletal protein RodZ
MKFKSGFLVGLGAGYVLGAKAGQERYQQIVDATKSLRENPGVRRLTGEVNRTVTVGKDRVSEAASRKVEQAGDAAAAQASKAKDAVSSVGKKTEDKTEAPTAPVSTTSASSGARPTSKP